MAGDQFGSSVAISGSTALVGAYDKIVDGQSYAGAADVDVLDGTPPVTTATGLQDSADAAWQNTPAKVSLSATDDAGGSGVAATYYTIDGGTQQTYSAPFTLLDGRHTVTYWSVDEAGNVEGANSGYANVDTTPPTTTVSGADGLWHNSAVTLTLTPIDNSGGSGMSGGSATTQYKIGTGDWTTGTTVVVLAPADHSADGFQTVSYRSCDEVGNWETAQTVTVKIDTTPPAVAASGAKDGAWLNHAVTITLSAADPGGSGVASISYSLDGVALVVDKASTQVVLSVSPNHLLTYQATDEVGNVSSQQSLTVHIDTVGPTTVAKPAHGHKGRAIALKYLVKDNLSPQATAVALTVRNSHGKLVKRFKLGTETISTWYAIRWTPTAKGSYRYAVTARDLAGNQQTTARKATITVK